MNESQVPMDTQSLVDHCNRVTSELEVAMEKLAQANDINVGLEAQLRRTVMIYNQQVEALNEKIKILEELKSLEDQLDFPSDELKTE